MNRRELANALLQDEGSVTPESAEGNSDPLLLGKNSREPAAKTVQSHQQI